MTDAPISAALNAEKVIAHFSPLYGHTEPNVNVLTFKRWLAAGRCVKKGESGLRIRVIIGRTEDEEKPGKQKTRGRWVSVFHIAQTEVCTEDSTREDPDNETANQAPAPARAPAPAPAPRARASLTDRQRADIQRQIARAARTAGGLEYTVSTGKRWRDSLGTMRSTRALAARDPELLAQLERAIRIVEAFEHVTIGSTGLDYFPSSGGTALVMMDLVRAHFADRNPATLDVLEPSAGDGALVAPAIEWGANVHAIERSSALCQCLKAQFADSATFGLTECGDFAELSAWMQFDAVIMNPPFDRGASAEHLRLAVERWAAPGGIVVGVVGEGCFSGGDAKRVPWFQAWLEDQAAEVIPTPKEAFIGTNANARIVAIRMKTRLI